MNIEGTEVKPLQPNAQEQEQQQAVNTDMKPSCILIEDGEGNIVTTAKINNYGDIVLVPGVLNVYSEFNNAADPNSDYKGHLFICAVNEAVVPITPDPNDPTKTEERRQLSEPYPSVVNRDDSALITNNGVVAEASVQVLSNGVLGDLTVIGEIDLG